MSRWNKNNRYPQTVVPLDNLLQKENKTVAIGTVMKWGDCKFTSIRSSCYNMGALSSTSPNQNTAESPPSNEFDDKISVEQVPKPRKFFKSRNSAPSTEVIAQQQMLTQPSINNQHHKNSYQKINTQSDSYSHPHQNPHSSSEDDLSPYHNKQIQQPKLQHGQEIAKRGKKKKEKPEKPPKAPPKPKPEKKVKVVVARPPPKTPEKVHEPSTRQSKIDAHGTRSSGRTRAKCVNYNEEADEADFIRRTERRVAPRLLQSTSTLSSPSAHQTEPAPADSTAAHPPIVLRISKGTSRLVSTDNEESVVTSPKPLNGDEGHGQNNSALASTDELIAVLSGEKQVNEPLLEPEPEKLKIRIKKDYIRSYNDSLKEQETKDVVQSIKHPSPLPVTETRTTRRRGKQPKEARTSPIVSEFDSQSSIVGSEQTASQIMTDGEGAATQTSLTANPSESDALVAEEKCPQKGGRGRGRKRVVEETPAPVAAPEPVRKTRNTRNAPVVEPEKILESPPKVQPATSRSTRNTRKNINTVTETASAVIEEPKPVQTAPARKFFTNRKRKNQEEEVKPEEVVEHENDEQMDALNLSQKSPEKVEPPASSPVPEYKHKKLVKRSWDLEKPQSIPEIAETESSNNNNENPPSTAVTNDGMKLVISKKKGSIFKSRAMEKEDEVSRKRKLYRHKWDEDDEMDGEEKKSEAGASGKSDKFEGEAASLKKEAASSVDAYDDFDDANDSKCDKVDKKFYVRNVKKAHQIQEIGEAQEMDDDVEYLLDALQPHIQASTRCLSALQLASKCLTPAFRMHIRAQGIVSKFFKALEDSPNDPSLGLCTAMVMFALSQDTLKMDLDRPSLELMLNLLECEENNKNYPIDNKQHLERKQKVREYCEDIQSQGKATHLNLDNITAAQLAMEALLSLTSKRAGEWLKEDLRELGGIEHIIKTVCECHNQMTDYVDTWTESLLEKLYKVERCMRILENVTSNNEENQKYILHYKSRLFVKTLTKIYQLLCHELSVYPTNDKTPKEPRTAAIAVREALVPLLKVLINLTHPFNDRAIGSVFFGEHKEVFNSSTNLMLFGPNHVPIKQQFDLKILTLVLLNNLAQSNEMNRQTIMQMTVPVEESSKEKQSAIKSLVEFFYKCEDNAKRIKRMTDEMLDETPREESRQNPREDSVNAVIQNSGTHMENSILGSLTSTLIGFVIKNNPTNEESVRRYMRNGKFNEMVEVLTLYYDFLGLTISSEPSQLAQVKTMKNVIDYLTEIDKI